MNHYGLGLKLLAEERKGGKNVKVSMKDFKVEMEMIKGMINEDR